MPLILLLEGEMLKPHTEGSDVAGIRILLKQSFLFIIKYTVLNVYFYAFGDKGHHAHTAIDV